MTGWLPKAPFLFAAPDIARKVQKFLNRNHFHILIAGCFGCLFQIQLTADRNAEYIDTGSFAPGNQGFEHLLRRHADGGSGMVAV